MPTRLTTAARNAAVDAIVDLIDPGGAGTIEIYQGTQPMSANDGTGASMLLGTLTFTDTPAAFNSASSGSASARAISDELSAAQGTAGWFRVKDGLGATVFDGNITATGAGGDLELNTVTIESGGPIRVSSFTFTIPASE